MNWQEFYAKIQKYYHIEDKSTVIQVPFENIVDINTDILVYKSNDGTLSHINLHNCVENFSSALGEELRNRSGNVIMAVGGRRFSKPVAFYDFLLMVTIQDST